LLCFAAIERSCCSTSTVLLPRTLTSGRASIVWLRSWNGTFSSRDAGVNVRMRMRAEMLVEPLAPPSTDPRPIAFASTSLVPKTSSPRIGPRPSASASTLEVTASSALGLAVAKIPALVLEMPLSLPLAKARPRARTSATVASPLAVASSVVRPLTLPSAVAAIEIAPSTVPIARILAELSAATLTEPVAVA
jgi:hypothetical protein